MADLIDKSLAITVVRQALVDAAHTHGSTMMKASSAMFKAEIYATNAIAAIAAYHGQTGKEVMPNVAEGSEAGHGVVYDATGPGVTAGAVEAAEAAILRLEWASGILIVEENRAETWQLAQDLRAALAAYRGGAK